MKFRENTGFETIPRIRVTAGLPMGAISALVYQTNRAFGAQTPWNYSHPYWENWSNVEEYKKVNGSVIF